MSYLEHFEQIVKDQLARVERLKASAELTDYVALDKIIVGTVDGDGIGPIIMDSCREVLRAKATTCQTSRAPMLRSAVSWICLQTCALL